MATTTLTAGARMRARNKADEAQPVFPCIADDLVMSQVNRADRFVREHRAQYVAMALAIQPDLTDWRQVWDRVAWAILTANAEYGTCRVAMRRLGAAREAQSYHMNLFDGLPGMTPAKLDYIFALPRETATLALTIGPLEKSWDAYRLRLRRDVKGLDMTKASYAATMLYPMTADVACLDTWMQKIFTWTTRFRSLSLPKYREIEAGIRVIARRHDVSTALCQWMLWDMVRGTTTDQRVFG